MDTLTYLRDQGFRLTKARKQLLRLFDTIPGPLPASEVLSRLKDEGIAVNKTTVYREIQFLLEQELVQEVDVGDGPKRYEAVHHHHHIVCTECQAIACLAADDLEPELHAYQEQLSQRTGFRQVAHALTFSGVCKACQPVLD